jgi:hypothetical protein
VRESLSFWGESRGGADTEAEADGDAWFYKKKKKMSSSPPPSRFRRALVARRSGTFWLHRPRLKGLESLTCEKKRLIVIARPARRERDGSATEAEKTKTRTGRDRAGGIKKKKKKKTRLGSVMFHASRVCNHRERSGNVGKM